MNYALCDENGNVVNIIYAAKPVFDYMYPIGEKPIMIGDIYRDGHFYRGDEEVLSMQEQYIEALRILDFFQEETDAE